MIPIRLKFLGEFRCVTADGPRADIPLAKYRGLLAVLALSPDFRASRTKLIDLLWSTRSNEQGRASLRQAIWSLKRYFGEEAESVLRVNRSDVGLNPESIQTDVDEFMRCTAQPTRDSLERAMSIYTGDFLQDLGLREAVWEEWLTQEREALHVRAVESLRALIDIYGSLPDPQSLIETGRRLVELEPYQEEGHRAIMLGYIESNQSAMALQQYERCRQLLEKELNASPDRNTQDLFAKVKTGSLPDRSMEMSDGKVPGTVRAPTEGRASRVIGELPRTGAHTDKPSILVVPFTNLSGEDEQDYLARGVTDNLIISLTRFRELFVFAYKTSMVTDNMTDPREAFERLGASYVVEGSVQRSGDRIRANVGLVATQTGRQIWAQNFDVEIGDLLTMQDEISHRVIGSLVDAVEETHHRLALTKTPDQLDAYDLVLKGRVLLSRHTVSGENEARECCHAAVELEPNYAPAYAELAISYSNELHAPWCRDPRSALLSLEQCARRAIELDGGNTAARYALACMHYFKGEYERANLEIEHAISLNPNDYHNICAKAWFMTFSGHLQEGIKCSIDGMRSSPYGADGCLETLGLAEYLAKNYDEALRAFGRTEKDSMFKLAGLAACYAQLGRDEEAAATSERFMAASDFDTKDDGSGNESWRTYWNRLYKFKEETDRHHLLDGLSKAGIPVD